MVRTCRAHTEREISSHYCFKALAHTSIALFISKEWERSWKRCTHPEIQRKLSISFQSPESKFALVTYNQILSILSPLISTDLYLQVGQSPIIDLGDKENAPCRQLFSTLPWSLVVYVTTEVLGIYGAVYV